MSKSQERELLWMKYPRSYEWAESEAIGLGGELDDTAGLSCCSYCSSCQTYCICNTLGALTANACTIN